LRNRYRSEKTRSHLAPSRAQIVACDVCSYSLPDC
jgi:hypothetical protein